MAFLKIFFTSLCASTFIFAGSLANSNVDEYSKTLNDYSVSETEGTISMTRLSRLLAQQKLPASYTCEKFPRVCRLKGSAGPDCCKKKCVNVRTDRLNCGICGYKCKYTEICCGGKCVNASFDKKHCGGCNKKCKKGNLCAYGMCSYA